MPAFFDTPIFGNCDDIAFSMCTRPIPKITASGSCSSDLDSATAKPDSWGALLEKIDALGDVCLKPLPKSASSDGFLITKPVFRGKPVKVLCGLAVKNYKAKQFSTDHLLKECDLFNRMFNGSDGAGCLRILFVCCTCYSKDLSSELKGKPFFVYQYKKSFPSIDEVILLNLETPKQRAAFFGVEDDLSVIVESVVCKAEVEFTGK